MPTFKLKQGKLQGAFRAALFFITCVVFVPGAPAQNSRGGVEEFFSKKDPVSLLDEKIQEFETNHTTAAAVILNAQTGGIVYTYNPEYVYRRRFGPGSIAKVYSAVVLLENASLFRFHPSRPVQCQGKFFIDESRLGRYDHNVINLQPGSHEREVAFRCSLRSGHGETGLYHALVKSCNTYFLNAVSGRPHEFYRLMQKKWKLGEATGVSLKKGYELPGLRQIDAPSSDIRALFSVIGEGGAIVASPLKVAQTFAAFFEQTPVLKPYMAAPGMKRKKRAVQYPLEISKKTHATVFAALQAVLTEGTLKDLKVQNQRVKLIAGKTGTGTHLNRKFANHGWNVIYFSMKGSNYVLVSFAYHGSGAGKARILSETILNLL